MKKMPILPKVHLNHTIIDVSFLTNRCFLKLAMVILLLSSGLLANAQKSQIEILQEFNSGSYIVYKLGEKNKFEKIKKQWPIEITKSGDRISKVLVKRAGILDEFFVPDVPGYPAYFAYKTFRLTFLNGFAVYYEWNGKEQATTKYVLAKDGGSFNLDFEATNKKVADYAKATFKMQTTARADVKVEKAVLAESERKANSLQGKAVATIAIQLIEKPEKVGHFSKAIQYGIVATLKNGSKLKTANLGGEIPWEDFKLSHKGCSNTIDEVRVDEDASSLTEDAIILNVASTYHPGLKTKKIINTTNDVSIQSNSNGFWGWERKKHMTVFQGIDGQHAGHGDYLTVKVKTVSHKRTGAKINKIEVYNETEQKTISRYKLTPSTKLIINATGGQGMDGRKGRDSESVGGNGGNGGRGGNVTLIKDPSVSTLNIEINNQGGKGGAGGPPYYSSGSRGNKGSRGEDGEKVTRTQSVSLNF